MEIWLSARFFSTPFLCHNGIGSFVLGVKVDERQETWEQMEDVPTEVRAGQAGPRWTHRGSLIGTGRYSTR